MLFRVVSLALLLAPAAAFNPASVRFATKASRSCRSADGPVARIGYVSSPSRAGELQGNQGMGEMYGGGYGGMYGGGGYGGMGGYGMGGYGMGGMSRARQMSYDGSMYSAYGNQGGYGYSGMGGGMGGMSRYGGMGGYGGYGMNGMNGGYGRFDRQAGGYGMNSMNGGYGGGGYSMNGGNGMGGYGMGGYKQTVGHSTPTHDYFMGMARSRRQGLSTEMQDHEYRYSVGGRHQMMYR